MVPLSSVPVPVCFLRSLSIHCGPKTQNKCSYHHDHTGRCAVTLSCWSQGTTVPNTGCHGVSGRNTNSRTHLTRVITRIPTLVVGLKCTHRHSHSLLHMNLSRLAQQLGGGTRSKLFHLQHMDHAWGGDFAHDTPTPLITTGMLPQLSPEIQTLDSVHERL